MSNDTEDRIIEDGATIIDYSTDVGSQDAPNPLPTGEYTGTVTAAVAKVSTTSGKPNAMFTYSITPEQYPVDYSDGNPDGETMSLYVSLADLPRPRFKMKKHCEAHGVVASKQIDLNAFIGQEAKLTIVHEAYEGVMQAKIKRVSAID